MTGCTWLFLMQNFRQIRIHQFMPGLHGTSGLPWSVVTAGKSAKSFMWGEPEVYISSQIVHSHPPRSNLPKFSFSVFFYLIWIFYLVSFCYGLVYVSVDLSCTHFCVHCPFNESWVDHSGSLRIVTSTNLFQYGCFRDLEARPGNLIKKTDKSSREKPWPTYLCLRYSKEVHPPSYLLKRLSHQIRNAWSDINEKSLVRTCYYKDFNKFNFSWHFFL
jgi:hypothetical protein